MKKTLIMIAVLATMSASAFATNGTTPSTSTCNGTGACSPDQRANTTTVGDNRNGQIANGGSIANGANVQAYGGTGGRSTSTATGGTSTSTSNGGSSSASISAGAVTNSVNAGTHTATVGNTSATGGSVGNTSATGGSVGNTSSTSSSGGNTLTGGAVSNSNSNASTVSGVAGVNGGINISTVDSHSLDVARVNADAARDVAREMSSITIRNVPNVSASALTSSNDTCMGSASGGVSAPGFGLSLGKTYTDDNCVMLKNSRELWNMGMKAAAMALMCTDSANKEALELTGYVCPQTAREQQRASSNASAPSPQYTDPVVRSRMGLPALK